MEELPLDIIHIIAASIPSPLDCYAFSCVSSIIRSYIKIHYSRLLTLTLCQGIAGTRLQELPNREKILWGYHSTGKKYLLLHYISSYIRRTGKRVLCITEEIKSMRWLNLSEDILNDLSFCYNDPDTIFEPDEWDFVIIDYESLQESDADTSQYGLMIIDNDELIEDVNDMMEVIYLRRENPFVDHIPSSAYIHIKPVCPFLPRRSYSPYPYYRELSDPLSKDLIKMLLKEYRRVLIIASVEPPKDILKAEDITIYYVDPYTFESGVSQYDEINQHSDKEVLIIVPDYMALYSTFHVACILHYVMDPDTYEVHFQHFYKDSAEMESSVICPSNPCRRVSIFHLFHGEERTACYFFYAYLSMSYRILRYRCPLYSSSSSFPSSPYKILQLYLQKRSIPLTKELINKAIKTCECINLDYKNLTPLIFTALCFPHLYPYIQNIETIDRFNEYEYAYKSRS